MPHRARIEFTTLIAAFVLAGAGAAGGGTRVLHVPDQYPGIQQAIDAAAPFDTVLVGPGTYNESLVVSGGRRGLVLTSASGAERTILQGISGARIVTFDEADTMTELSGFTLRGGDPQFDGGAVYAYRSQLLITDCRFEGNESGGDGGAIALYETWALLWRNIISANTSRQGGGIYCNGSTVTLAKNTIRNNHSHQDGGGAMLLSSEPTLEYNSFIGNVADGNGGGVANMSTYGIFRENFFTRNQAQSGGGFLCAGGSQPDLTSNRFDGNRPANLAGCSSGAIEQ